MIVRRPAEVDRDPQAYVAGWVGRFNREARRRSPGYGVGILIGLNGNTAWISQAPPFVVVLA